MERKAASRLCIKWTDANKGRGEETAFAPLIHLSGAFHFNQRWSVSAEVDGISTGNEYYWNAGMWLRFQPTQL